MLVTARLAYVLRIVHTYMITLAKSDRRNTRYDTCENIPFAIVTFLLRSPFEPALRLFREKWNMSEPLEIPARNSILRASSKRRILNKENSLNLFNYLSNALNARVDCFSYKTLRCVIDGIDGTLMEFFNIPSEKHTHVNRDTRQKFR